MPRRSAGSALVLLLGGNANNGTNDGLFYGNWNNTASNSNWNIGARSLSAFPFQTDGEAAAYNLAVWRK